jgi:BirA family biotin operon repressor/biotin-[acetyl-CoA-carboxylase] ligase
MRGLTIRTLHYDSLPSTNTELARLAASGESEGLCVLADEQTAGRGRLQRRWSSPKGAGLYFSILLQPVIPLSSWPLVTFVAALAVGDALQDAFKLHTDIKWPNDLLTGERKICGILSETIETPEGRAVIIGIGINLTAGAYPAELKGLATSVSEETRQPADKELLVSSLQNAIARWYATLQSDNGDQRILQTWVSRSPYANGRAIEVRNGDESFQGITRGLERDGALRVETEDEGIRIVRAGDVISVRSSSRN